MGISRAGSRFDQWKKITPSTKPYVQKRQQPSSFNSHNKDGIVSRTFLVFHSHGTFLHPSYCSMKIFSCELNEISKRWWEYVLQTETTWSTKLMWRDCNSIFRWKLPVLLLTSKHLWTREKMWKPTREYVMESWNHTEFVISFVILYMYEVSETNRTTTGPHRLLLGFWFLFFFIILLIIWPFVSPQAKCSIPL